MSQPRRTFLQVLLGLFGLGAANAVAKTDDESVVQALNAAQDGDLVRISNPEQIDRLVQKFDAAIGVVNNRGRIQFALRHLRSDKLHCTSAFGGLGIEIAMDAIVATARTMNAMIFAEANGPDGAQLVAELMRRCPERVYQSKRYRLDVESFPGYDTSLLRREWVECLTSEHNWVTDDSHQALARCLAIIGTQILNEDKLNAIANRIILKSKQVMG